MPTVHLCARATHVRGPRSVPALTPVMFTGWLRLYSIAPRAQQRKKADKVSTFRSELVGREIWWWVGKNGEKEGGGGGGRLKPSLEGSVVVSICWAEPSDLCDNVLRLFEIVVNSSNASLMDRSWSEILDLVFAPLWYRTIFLRRHF